MKLRIPILTVFLALLLLGCDKIDITGFGVTVNTRFKDSIRWNENNPPKVVTAENDSYTVYCMSDSHVGTLGNLDLFLGKASQAEAVAVAMVGDLTTGKGEDYEKFHRRLLQETDNTLIPIAGNHDLYYGGWEEFYTRFGSSTFTFTVETPEATDLFICLDTGSGTLGPKQLEWLENLLKTTRTNYRHCIVLSHLHFFGFNPFSIEGFMPEESDFLMKLFLEHNVNMAISGHLHYKQEGTFGNTTYLVMEPLTENYSDPGYLTLTVTGDQLSYSFEKLHQ